MTVGCKHKHKNLTIPYFIYKAMLLRNTPAPLLSMPTF